MITTGTIDWMPVVDIGYVALSRVDAFGDLLLQPLVEPLEVGALPQHAVLRTQYPVVLVGVDEQFGRDAADDGGIEGSHAL